jgi:hypothetical protein
MRGIFTSLVVAGCAVVALSFGSSARAAEATEPRAKMLAHDVYFSLNDNSPEAKAKLIAACKKYLSDHPGTVWFAAGPLAEDLNRDVNDRAFDVALHLVFQDKAAHDRYAKAEKHLKFIEEYQGNWKKVRVFDSYVEAFSHGTVEGMPGQPAAKAKKAPATKLPKTRTAVEASGQ